jgi:hypothetical protein
MPDNFRYRYGDVRPVRVAVASATVIEIGDLVYLASGAALPFSAQADLGTKAQNQEGAHDAFIGVSLSRSRNGDADPITIATAGVFEFDLASATLAIGSLVGPAGTGEAGAVGVANQSIESVATANLAIGRTVEAITSATKVKVDIVSTVIYGGPQAMA